MGTRTNTRDKIVEEANGGTCSGEPTEVEECMEKECPGKIIHAYVTEMLDTQLHLSFFNIEYIFFIVHCEWNDWVEGECSKECGGGMKINTRTEKVSAEHGGEDCPGPASEEISCNEQECPGK